MPEPSLISSLSYTDPAKKRSFGISLILLKTFGILYLIPLSWLRKMALAVFMIQDYPMDL